MSSDSLLVMAMALPPVLLSCRLWWYVHHACEDLGPGRAVFPVRTNRRDEPL